MRFVPIPKQEMPAHNGYRKTKNQRLAEDFLASGAECARLEGWRYCSASVGVQTLAASFERYGYHQIAVVRRGDEIYLVKKEE